MVWPSVVVEKPKGEHVHPKENVLTVARHKMGFVS